MQLKPRPKTKKMKQNYKVPTPKIEPGDFIQQLKKNGIKTISLFSGCGGLDLGFIRAGFDILCFNETHDKSANTLRLNHQKIKVHGDVTETDFRKYDKPDVIIGGPPCQPFSKNGKLKGGDDERDMIPAFMQIVKTLRPKIFLIENVPNILSDRFYEYVREQIFIPARDEKYTTIKCLLHANDFGCPQNRQRVFFIGFRNKKFMKNFHIPLPTHSFEMGVREALGLPAIGFDTLAPTLTSGLKKKNPTTSIMNSAYAKGVWEKLQIWAHGIQKTRLDALDKAVQGKNHGCYRLSLEDIKIIQGFPKDYVFSGPIYSVLGQIGNSVAPPLAYNLAIAIRDAILSVKK